MFTPFIFCHLTPDGRIFLAASNQESNQNGLEVVQEMDDRIMELKPISGDNTGESVAIFTLNI